MLFFPSKETDEAYYAEDVENTFQLPLPPGLPLTGKKVIVSQSNADFIQNCHYFASVVIEFQAL